jgi:hypothetical protein
VKTPLYRTDRYLPTQRARRGLTRGERWGIAYLVARCLLGLGGAAYGIYHMVTHWPWWQ